MADTITEALDITGRTLVVGTRIAYATLAYKSAHLRLGHVKAFKAGYNGRPLVLCAGDHGKSTWQSASNVASTEATNV